jgi:hypothetical protein
MRRLCSSHYKALRDAETEVIEEDWSECMDHIKSARRAQQVCATPKRVVSIAIGRSAPRPPLALEIPPTLLARAGEEIEIEFSCAVRESGTRAPWTARSDVTNAACRKPSSNEAPGRFGFEIQ